MINYKRFDNIDTDSEDDDQQNIKKSETLDIPASSKPVKVGTKKNANGLYKFEHNGQTIYEWEQSLEEVNIFVTPPPGVTRTMIEIHIMHTHLSIGLKGVPPFIDEDTGGPVKVDESMWTLTDGVLNINLQKMNKAEAWDCALKGRAGEVLDPVTQEEVKKKLMLERFQEEVCVRCWKYLFIFSFL